MLRGEIDTCMMPPPPTWCSLLARQADGAGLFAVQTNSARRLGDARSTESTRPAKQFRVALDGATAQRLADASPDAVEALVDDVVIAWAADALGAARAVMDLAVEYAKVRRQFGQPIGAFQAVQHLCVDMFETVELARSGVIHALWAADAGDVASGIWPRCGPRRSPGGWPASAIPPSRCSAALATPGSTTRTCISSGC